MVKGFTVITQDQFGEIKFIFYSLKDVLEWINKNNDKKLEELEKQAVLYFKAQGMHH